MADPAERNRYLVSGDHNPESLEYIRREYGVPVALGKRITYRGRHRGTIIGCRHAYLIVKFDYPHDRWPDGKAVLLHPTWEVEYDPQPVWIGEGSPADVG